MFDPADAFLCHSKKQFAITRNTRRRIVHLRIIKAEGNHCAFALDFNPQHHVIGVVSPAISFTTAPAVLNSFYALP